MNANFNQVLLIDNNRVSSFFNKIILKKTGHIKNIISLENCLQALDFVDPKKTLNPIADIIFLSLNTPFMNGWEFLEKYEELQKIKESNVVVLYDDELLEEEENKLDQYSFVKSVINRRIDINDLYEIYDKISKKRELQLIS